MFEDLLKPQNSCIPKEQQKFAKDKLPEMINASSVFTQYDEKVVFKDCIILGMATYSM
jgi:hypothetical protein